jgi:hypothetical protein
MKTASVFVGLMHCPPGRHDAFLEWHDLDHRPENVGQIPHLFHSARWIAPPESLPSRESRVDGPVTEAGEYLLTYWSTASPQQLKNDMFVLRDQLAALGRCQPMERDFTIGWREYMRPVRAYVDPRLGFSPDTVPLMPHDGVVLTVGREPDDGGMWSAEYDREILPGLFAGGSLVSALTLTATPEAEQPRFVHLHYTRGNPVEVQQSIRAAVGTKPTIDYRAAYVPQHWSEPRYFQ